MSSASKPTHLTNPARALLEFALQVAGQEWDRFMGCPRPRSPSVVGPELHQREARLRQLRDAALAVAHQAAIPGAEVEARVVAVEEAVKGVMLWELPGLRRPIDPDREEVYISDAINRLGAAVAPLARLAALIDPKGEVEDAHAEGTKPAEAADPNEMAAVIEALGGSTAAKVFVVARDTSLTVDQRQRAIYRLDNRAVAWTGNRWATLLRVTRQAATQTEWWLDDRQKLMRDE